MGEWYMTVKRKSFLYLLFKQYAKFFLIQCNACCKEAIKKWATTLLGFKQIKQCNFDWNTKKTQTGVIQNPCA